MIFTQENTGYFLNPATAWFCEEPPYVNLAIIGIVVPALVWLVFYLGIYKWDWAPGKRIVRSLYWLVLVLLMVFVFVGSFLNVGYFSDPENLLCDENGTAATEVIQAYKDSYRVDYDTAVQALYVNKGIVILDFQLYLALNNLIYAVIVTLIFTFILRFFSDHARYAPL